ncbi:MULTISPECIES: hypothetical protein [Burkholderia]|uniref:hypothetical protein n=1 Tax=Burkholderia TaxID=32008 RepID=UPI0012E9B043|nr:MULTISPECIES: hypothetical protein [unclassified Burkholderia]
MDKYQARIEAIVATWKFCQRTDGAEPETLSRHSSTGILLEASRKSRWSDGIDDGQI